MEGKDIESFLSAKGETVRRISTDAGIEIVPRDGLDEQALADAVAAADWRQEKAEAAVDGPETMQNELATGGDRPVEEEAAEGGQSVRFEQVHAAIAGMTAADARLACAELGVAVGGNDATAEKPSLDSISLVQLQKALRAHFANIAAGSVTSPPPPQSSPPPPPPSPSG